MALVAHPDDARYRPLFGTEVVTPLFKARVPVVAHPLADPEKGTGVAMVCTFGDLTDVVWWRELDLPTRTVLGRDGRLLPVTWGEGAFDSEDPAAADAAYAELAGRTARQAQERVVALLAASGDLVGEPRPITHPVKFYEKGERPLEIVSSRQWFVRTLDLRQRLLARGEQLRWHPAHMAHRYRAWVEGLGSDWNISRQRFFGVPFPVWYPVGDDGEPDYARPLVPGEGRLPVDPSTDAPDGYTEDQRGRPGGFVGDPDVMDTWATSSLTPLIAGRWEDDPDLFARVFPMDLRPQAHDIIRTWLFSTVVRAELEFGSLPWSDVAISGWVLDPTRKKMSKSKGNVVTPLPLLAEHGADSVRYWAASGRPGTDTAVDTGQMQVGRRLAIKVLNASKFVLGPVGRGDRAGARGGDDAPRPRPPAPPGRGGRRGHGRPRRLRLHPGARGGRGVLLVVLRRLPRTGEGPRLRRPGRRGHRARPAPRLALALSVQVRLFAPFLPFVTEEVWSWWREGSVHRAAWPDGRRARTGLRPRRGGRRLGGPRRRGRGARGRPPAEDDREALDARPGRPLHRGGPGRCGWTPCGLAEGDLAEAGGLDELVLVEGVEPSVEVVLAPDA